MAIRWKLAGPLKRAGIENAYQLAERAGIGYPAAVRIFAAAERDKSLGRFDLRTLEKLAVLFRVKPWTLLDYRPDD